MLEKQTILDWFEAHREEYLRDLTALVAIPSVKGESAPGAPFGAEPRRALDAALKLAAGWGLAVSDDDGYVGMVDLGGDEPCLDILAHLDVVPAGEGWSVTTPFQLLRKDGWLYGRGTSDDKGPALAALYAMRCLKELGAPLGKRCRLILGTDEECGSSDIAHYYAHTPEAPMSFSPDAEYPLINVEKGRYDGTGTVRSAEPSPVVSIAAGIASNVVPGKARCVLHGIPEGTVSEAAKRVSERTGTEITLTPGAADGTLFLLVEGAQAHASTPELGNNAVTALLALLSELPLGGGAVPEALRTLSRLFPHGDTEGKAAGIFGEDETGRLTLCLSMLNLADGALKAQWDSRAPVSVTEEQLRRLDGVLREAGFRTEGSWSEPHVVPPEHPLVRTLLRCYTEYTGKPGACVAIGGGTYVHHLKNGVAFGCSFPGTDNRMHGADERAVEDDLILSGALFAASVEALCGAED